MRVQLQQREATDGSLATGMLVGLWIGETLAATEYWLLRASDMLTRAASWVLRRPAIIAFSCGVGLLGGMTANVGMLLRDNQVQTARLDLRALAESAQLYRHETGQWPTTLQMLVPGYVKELHADPWGNNYALYRGEGGIAIVSAGRDRELGTADDVVRVIQAR